MESVRRTRCALEGADHDAGRHRLSQHQRPLAAGAGPVRLHSPLQALRGRAQLLQRSADRPGDRAREYRETFTPGIEFERGKPETAELIKHINQTSPSGRSRSGPDETGITIKSISVSGTERIVHCAFDYARAQQPEEGHGRPQGEHLEVHRRTVPRGRRGRWPRNIRTSSSRTGSSTTCACSWCRSPSCMTCWCCRTCTATSSATWRPGWSAGWALRRGRTSGPRGRSSKPRTAVRRSTRGRTR